MVAVVMIILDIASTVLCAKVMYIYFVPHFGSMLPLQTLTPHVGCEDRGANVDLAIEPLPLNVISL
ncbi:uncharacterized protein BT62DRAFT_937002 [Guyanagaster necrorhizus]|uniref:Uncharacterized protein n=1 Tax=Guyanagaster necrorhizus TaxID=856835 RepID=A0A9P7VJH2_9AGAR|nr:uncharacterized protein BT62DRAFT_937002 [Guyanagaster necrorhizus MCA 3950]KAG7441480.1 hypothetical protein BT62DRAFT_937002 [Guyanagaster necrorhizus MCA 3950]